MPKLPMIPVVRAFGREAAIRPTLWDIRAARLMSIVRRPNVYTMKTANVMPDISESAEGMASVTAKKQNAQAFAVNSAKDLKEQIEKERERLDEMVESGLDAKTILDQSQKLDELVEKYYESLKTSE